MTLQAGMRSGRPAPTATAGIQRLQPSRCCSKARAFSSGAQRQQHSRGEYIPVEAVIMQHRPILLRIGHRWHSIAEPFHDKTMIGRCSCRWCLRTGSVAMLSLFKHAGLFQPCTHAHLSCISSFTQS